MRSMSLMLRAASVPVWTLAERADRPSQNARASEDPRKPPHILIFEVAAGRPLVHSNNKHVYARFVDFGDINSVGRRLPFLIALQLTQVAKQEFDSVEPQNHPARRAAHNTTRSTPRPPWTESTCYAPRYPPTHSTPPGRGRLQNLAHIERDFRIIKSLRPGPAPHLPLPRRPGPRTRADLHARGLPHLAPTQSLGTLDLHRPTTRPGQPRRPPPNAPPTPTAKPPTSTTNSAAPTIISLAYSTTPATCEPA